MEFNLLVHWWEQLISFNECAGIWLEFAWSKKIGLYLFYLQIYGETLNLFQKESLY